MEELFGNLSRAVEGAPLVALSAALAWGVLSILLSPCHLASIPLVVGFISGQGRLTTGRACLLATLFSVGILITIAALGLVTAAAGRMVGDVGPWGNYLVAGIFFLVGLHLLEVIPLPFPGPGTPGMKSRGKLAALVLGLVFGIALGPCTFAFLAPVLAVAFGAARSAWAWGALLLIAYGIGHCSVIVAAGTSVELVQRYLRWNERSRALRCVKWTCGALVALGGVYLIYVAR
jgi:cytochrome c-type biogenesis protein